ncbi:MAG: ADP-heptose--LPS heptosyltransferase RfaF, partial [Owenweeksia sp.]
LPHSTERYAQVFREAGLTLHFDPGNQVEIAFNGAADFSRLLPEDPQTPLIGVAPFAQHQGKMWPLAKMKELLILLTEKGYHI